MLSASFIFTETRLDDEFFRLDGLIAQAAEATPGLLGKENWVTTHGTKKNSVYYWEDHAALKVFSGHPLHMQAKRQYEKWYWRVPRCHLGGGQILRRWRIGALAHITPQQPSCKARPNPLIRKARPPI